MTAIGKGGQRQAFRNQRAAAGEQDPVLRTIADGFIAAHTTLCQAAGELDCAVKEIASKHAVARRLMAIPGIGPIVSLRFVALLDTPSRFPRVGDVGAFLDLTPRRHQFGDVDWPGRISKCGDRIVRGLLFEAASTLISRAKRSSTLKSWAVRLAGRRGFAKAAIATARKRAVLMPSLWKNETAFKWTRAAVA